MDKNRNSRQNKQSFNSKKHNSLKNRTEEFAEETVHNVQEGVSRVGRRMKQSGEGIVDRTKAFSNNVEEIAEETVHNVTKSARKAGNKIKRTGSNILNGSESVSDDIEEFAEDIDLRDIGNDIDDESVSSNDEEFAEDNDMSDIDTEIDEENQDRVFSNNEDEDQRDY